MCVYLPVYYCTANHMTCIYPKLLINTLVSAPSPWPEKVTLPLLTSLFSPFYLLVLYLAHLTHSCVCNWKSTVQVRVFVCSVCLLNALSLRSWGRKWTESQIKIVYISFSHCRKGGIEWRFISESHKQKSLESHVHKARGDCFINYLWSVAPGLINTEMLFRCLKINRRCELYNIPLSRCCVSQCRCSTQNKNHVHLCKWTNMRLDVCFVHLFKGQY